MNKWKNEKYTRKIGKKKENYKKHRWNKEQYQRTAETKAVFDIRIRKTMKGIQNIRVRKNRKDGEKMKKNKKNNKNDVNEKIYEQ